ncbi:MAG: orotidine 5-phosphate decarboxylase [Roseovarius sp.]|nr:orotidine 5-phosphate decarboxylase [Roseovarius sp.]
MKRQLALALILGLATDMAQAQTILGEQVSLAHGSYTSGGGLTIATELRAKDGKTALCGTWAQSASQSSYTSGTARKIVQMASVYVEGKRIHQDLGFMPQTEARLDYAGAPARCVLTDLPWRAGRVPEVFLPRQTISHGNGGGSDPTITFRQTGAGAMGHGLEVVPFLTRNSRLVRLAPGPSIAEGRYNTGGGVRVAAELVSVNGTAHICGVWSDLPGQADRTAHLGREILRRTTVRQAGKTLLSNLSEFRRVSARSDYTGVDATCLDTGRPWAARDARKAVTLRLPNQIVYRSTTAKGREVIRFQP